jgi:hypothetical protein
MAIKYEYSSTCCSHYYIETRNNNDAQVVTKCNVCGQGEYELTTQTEIETIAEPVYHGSNDQIVSTRDRFISAGFTQEEIDLLIQESQTEQ